MRAGRLQHIIITRFNCRFGHLPKHLTFKMLLNQQWLDERFKLFERYCAPTLLAQSSNNFLWLVYFDKDTPRSYLERAEQALEARQNMRIVLCDAFTIETLKDDVRRHVPPDCEWLVTTRLDNDDGLRSDFVERLQREVRRKGPEALNFPVGLVLGANRLYRSEQPSNAFVSVSEPYGRDFLTAHCASHNEMAARLSVRDIGDGLPAWLQVIHGGNVSNKLRGHRIPFQEGREGFVPLERMDLAMPGTESSLRIAIENASIGTFWAVRDRAARTYRRLRR